MFGKMIFSQNMLSVPGEENSSPWLPILTTTDRKRRARETSWVERSDMLANGLTTETHHILSGARTYIRQDVPNSLDEAS